MDDLDFSQQAAPQPPAAPAAAKSVAVAPPPAYDAKLAARFFRIAGTEEIVAATTCIFAENTRPSGGFFSKGARIYLLLEGQVALTLNNKPLHLVLPGEIFGEMALISDAPRSATATALKKSRVLALDEKSFLVALAREPEFALMLVGTLAAQLRRGFERLLANKTDPLPPRAGGRGLSDEQLIALRHALGDPLPTPMRAGEAIVNKGALGMFMFVVTAGQVAISIDDMVVEHIGAGETFGEMALLGPTSRAATATVETEGAWLPVSRQAFLDVTRAQPAIGIALLRSLSERLQHLNTQLGG